MRSVLSLQSLVLVVFLSDFLFKIKGRKFAIHLIARWFYLCLMKLFKLFLIVSMGKTNGKKYQNYWKIGQALFHSNKEGRKMILYICNS